MNRLIFILSLALLFTFKIFSNEIFMEPSSNTNLELEKKINDWTIFEIEKYAIDNNPLYLSEKKNVSMARGDVITAALYRNPVFTYQQQFIGSSSSSIGNPLVVSKADPGGGVEYSPMLSQDLDMNGTIAQKIKVSKQALNVELANFEDFDRLFRLRLRQNYWHYLFLSELAENQREFYENFEELLRLTKFRAEKGDISELEYDRLSLEKVRIEKEYKETLVHRAHSARDLRVLIGLEPTGKLLNLRNRLKFLTATELNLKLDNNSIDYRPDYTAQKYKVKQNKLTIDLKKKEGALYSSLNVGAELRHKASENYFGFAVSVPIKIFDRNQGEILKSEENYSKSILQLENKRRSILSDIRSSLQELKSREAILLEYRNNNILEKNKDVHEKYMLAYKKGATNLVTFLESERNYFTVLRGYYELLYLYYASIEQYQAAVGRFLELNYYKE